MDNGTFIASANTSYPIFQNGQLSGAVTFEHTEETIQKYYQSIQDTRQALKHFSGSAAPVRFSGYTFENVIGGSEKLRSAAELAQRWPPRTAPSCWWERRARGKRSLPRASTAPAPGRGKISWPSTGAAIPETLIGKSALRHGQGQLYRQRGQGRLL